MTNKRKIINDPVYGFVTIPSDLIFELIQHPFFQRLRRIKQLGMSELVYPGALHTRFQHALGAMHLMGQAINSLQTKGHLIMDIEKEAAQIAILLHDLGHGPFSHVLEFAILDNIHHEQISEMLMKELNNQFSGRLELAIQMFNNTYHRTFFHQLISSQLDMDRLDYINRDSFFTGVSEGTIGVDRIIKMLNIVDNQLVVEEKGLLSVENFLNARRLMYWQVYLHKASISAETMLKKVFSRVRFLLDNGEKIFYPSALLRFISSKIGIKDFESDNTLLLDFVSLDDHDIWFSLKTWQNHPDEILSKISKDLLNRKFYKIILTNEPIENSIIEDKVNTIKRKLVHQEDSQYFVEQGSISNSGYIPMNSNIKIITKNNGIIDISEASDLPTIKALSKIIKKNYLCWSNELYLQ